MYVNYIDYSYSTIIIIMIIMEVFNLSVIQIYEQNHCSLVYN